MEEGDGADLLVEKTCGEVKTLFCEEVGVPD